MGVVGEGKGLIPSEVWLELPAVVVPPSSSSPNANANCPHRPRFSSSLLAQMPRKLRGKNDAEREGTHPGQLLR